MLNDINILNQKDPSGALSAIFSLTDQATFQPEITNPDNRREIDNIVVAGMGGSALAAEVAKVLLAHELKKPFEIIKGYQLPEYVGEKTLVIAISHSGSTEETLSCFDQAVAKNAIVCTMSTGGELKNRALAQNILHSTIPSGAQPRMSTVYHLRVLLNILHHFELISLEPFEAIANAADFLRAHLNYWTFETPVEHNFAKQLAIASVGKTAIFYGGEVTAPLAYKWKISWNESAKNVAFWNRYPEFNHNEFMGWTSHPIEKPFIVFDLQSSFESQRIKNRMLLSDQMLSGLRPKSHAVPFTGDNLTEQILYGLALADAASIYLAFLNDVDPTPVALIEKFKHNLTTFQAE